MKLSSFILLGYVKRPLDCYVDSRNKFIFTQSYLFSSNLFRALSSSFGSGTCISTDPVPLFPRVNLLLRRFRFLTISGSTTFYLPLCNLFGVRELLRFFSTLILRLLVVKSPIVVVHGLNFSLLASSIVFKLLGAKVCVVLTDPPGEALPSESFVMTRFRAVNRYCIMFFLRRVDCVVALNPGLILEYGFDHPSYCFPGFYSEIDGFVPAIGKPVDDVFRIVYAGSLAESYGVLNLINAVIKLSYIRSVKLIICGSGDLYDQIEKLSVDSACIDFRGSLARDDLINVYASAHCLVNPRLSSFERKSNAFPSKLLEYLSAGPVVISTPLSWIPDCLSDAIVFSRDDTVDGLHDAILDVCDSSFELLSKESIESRKMAVSQFGVERVGFNLFNLISGSDCV